MPHGRRVGRRTSWTIFGTGPRPALALHAGLSSGRAWRELARFLEDRLTITAPDLPGHGGTAPLDPGSDFVAVASDLAETFCDEPQDIIGHSVGAVVALDLAVRRPDLVRTLTLIEPVLIAAAADSPEFSDYLDDFAPISKALAQGDRKEAARGFLGIWGAGVPWQAFPEAERARLAAEIDLVTVSDDALVRDGRGLLGQGRLERIKAPVLLVEGDQSPPIVARVLDAFVPRLNLWSRLSVPGAGHMVPLTHPGAVADAIGALVAAHEV